MPFFAGQLGRQLAVYQHHKPVRGPWNNLYIPSGTYTMDGPFPDIERFSCLVTVYLKPEDVPKFYEACKPVFDETVKEEECLYFEVFEDPLVPGKVCWIENWNGTPEWFIKVRSSPYCPAARWTELMH
jgi:quinol monooxygenase YgiN